MQLELPYPPSMNHLWRRFGRRTLLSRGGRTFRRSVRTILLALGIRPISGRLAVTIDVFPPDRRRRDLDNTLKALLDALQHGGAYHDDSQIEDLHIRRGNCTPGGRVCVRLAPYPDPGPAADNPQPPDDAPGGAKQRGCLKCGKRFPSAGPGNRICPPCNRDNARLHLSEAEVRMQRGGKRRNGESLAPDALDRVAA